MYEIQFDKIYRNICKYYIYMTNKLINKTDIDPDCIGFWADFADLIGFPMSTGEVYGHLFISEKPLCADDIAAVTGASRSGIGQHLKVLTEIGAIRISHTVNNRKTHYELQTDLGVLIRRLTNSRFFPKIEELEQQRINLQKQAEESENAHLIERFAKLERWHQKISPLSKLLKSLI
tara:strand:- start:1392 stop:1922 length:531 start_codon:yes stop_codon:yes gene_type:complete